MDGKIFPVMSRREVDLRKVHLLKNEKWLFEEGGQLLTTLL